MNPGRGRVGVGGVVGRKRYGESNMETYITICKIDSQWEFVVQLRELTGSLTT